MKKIAAAYIIARNCEDTRVEYWSGTVWTFDKANGQTFKTMQAVDKAAAKLDTSRMLYVTE